MNYHPSLCQKEIYRIYNIYIYIYTLYLSIYELFNCKVEFSKIILPNMNPMTTQNKNAMIEMSPCPFNLRRNLFTLPTTDIALKIALPKKKVVSQPEFFRGHRYVSFRECNIRSTQLSPVPVPSDWIEDRRVQPLGICVGLMTFWTLRGLEKFQRCHSACRSCECSYTQGD